VEGTKTPHKVHAHFLRAMLVLRSVFNVLREIAEKVETPQEHSEEEAQLRPAESEVPGTDTTIPI
jgi:hypothetical protein